MPIAVQTHVRESICKPIYTVIFSKMTVRPAYVIKNSPEYNSGEFEKAADISRHDIGSDIGAGW